MDVRSARINPVDRRARRAVGAGRAVHGQGQLLAGGAHGNGARLSTRSAVPISGCTAAARRAFFGDYPHLAPSTVFEFDTGNRWKWATDPASALAIWTDHRDVQFPVNGIGWRLEQLHADQPTLGCASCSARRAAQRESLLHGDRGRRSRLAAELQAAERPARVRHLRREPHSAGPRLPPHADRDARHPSTSSRPARSCDVSRSSPTRATRRPSGWRRTLRSRPLRRGWRSWRST